MGEGGRGVVGRRAGRSWREMMAMPVTRRANGSQIGAELGGVGVAQAVGVDALFDASPGGEEFEPRQRPKTRLAAGQNDASV